MHKESRAFFEMLKRNLPKMFHGKRVIEIGSLDINGSLRDLFEDCHYVGVDLADGPGVDVIANAADLDYPIDAFDVAISSECFEHNPYWRQAFWNMHRWAGGLVAFSCAAPGRPEHGTRKCRPEDSPITAKLWDYYRPLGAVDFESEFDLAELFSTSSIHEDRDVCDLYFWGIPLK